MFGRGLVHLRRFDDSGHLTRRHRNDGRVAPDDAALMIQSFWRGRKERAKVGKLKSRKKPLGFYTHSLGLSYVHIGPKLGRGSFKQWLYSLVEEPGSSRLAEFVSFTLIATTLISIVGFIVDTVPEIGNRYPEAMYVLEVVCTLIFTADYASRLAVCSEAGVVRWDFVRKPLNVLDVLAVFPFYVEFLLRFIGARDAPGLNLLRLVRVVRVIRVFKMGRYASGMRVTARALAESSQAISVLVFLLCMGVVLFASALFYAERMSCPDFEDMSEGQLQAYAVECDDPYNKGVSPRYGLCCTDYGAPIDFPNIMAAAWWAMVTMTSVGYGEVLPRTTQGKCIGFVVMLTGMLVIALPAAIVGQKFQDAYESHNMDSAKDAAAARMRVPGERWTLVPSSDMTAKLKGLKIKDSATANSVAKFTMSLVEVWEQREQEMRARRYELEVHDEINVNMTRLLSGIQASVATHDEA